MPLCKTGAYTLPTIEFVGGSTQELVFHLYYQTASQPFDLSTCTANFSLINYVNKGGTPAISKPMTVEAADPDGGNYIQNVAKVTLLPGDTARLSGKYIYQISIKDVQGASDIPNQGIMHITLNIDPEFVED